MSLEQGRKISSKPQMETTTVDLKQSITKEDKYLCMQCLIEKIDIQNIVLVDETKVMIQEMKQEQYSLKIKQTQKRIETFILIQSQIKEFKVQVENVIEKILININEKIQLLEKNLAEYEGLKQMFPIEFDNIEDDNQIYNSIQQMFQSFTNNQLYNQVIDILQQNQKFLKPKETKETSIFKVKELDKSKTPSLNIKCPKHGKEIIMLNFKVNETQTSRLAFVDCIHYNKPIKYTSLQDAVQKQRLGQNQNILKLKISEIRRIIQNLKEMREQYTSILNQLILKLNNEQSSIQLIQQNQQNQKDIYEFNQKQIEELTLILSNQDKFKVLQDQLIKIEKENLIQFNLMFNNLFSLLEQELQKRKDDIIRKIQKFDATLNNFTEIREDFNNCKLLSFLYFQRFLKLLIQLNY
ncbi:unnamed protein product [Paramecium sonneborni]|uniref:Uncharacterized protein n=1 Tax=Paramecium sonneborni TaxID=65129 RepID=A0A8S1RTD8_9CILI|nr:unnamed protein product [Paramecium sonneborni]